MDKTKTGECWWRDEANQLWLAESWQDDNGAVDTTQTPYTDDGQVMVIDATPAVSQVY